MLLTTQLHLTRNPDQCAAHRNKEHIDNDICQDCLDYSKLFPTSAIAKRVMAMEHALWLNGTINTIVEHLHSYVAGYKPDRNDFKSIREDILFLVSSGQWEYSEYNKNADMAYVEYDLYKLSKAISKEQSMTRADMKEMFGLKDSSISNYLKLNNRKGCKLFTYTDIVNLIKVA